MYGRRNPITDIYRRLGKEERSNVILPNWSDENVLVDYHNGRPKPMAEMWNPAEMKRVNELIAQISDEENKGTVGCALKDWALQVTTDPGYNASSRFGGHVYA